MTRSVRTKISNNFSEPITLWLEPWGADFGMMPEDEFEVIADNADEEFYFHIILHKDFQVYAEGNSDYPRVVQNGKELWTGHNRFWNER